MMTTADGMHTSFSGRHPQLFYISDLYRVDTELAEVHADIARSFLKTLVTLVNGTTVEISRQSINWFHTEKFAVYFTIAIELHPIV